MLYVQQIDDTYEHLERSEEIQCLWLGEFSLLIVLRRKEDISRPIFLNLPKGGPEAFKRLGITPPKGILL